MSLFVAFISLIDIYLVEIRISNFKSTASPSTAFERPPSEPIRKLAEQLNLLLSFCLSLHHAYYRAEIQQGCNAVRRRHIRLHQAKVAGGGNKKSTHPCVCVDRFEIQFSNLSRCVPSKSMKEGVPICLVNLNEERNDGRKSLTVQSFSSSRKRQIPAWNLMLMERF